jgi:hypothetical protein
MRGGKRTGAGRKKDPAKMTFVGTSLPIEVLSVLDDRAAKRELSRSQLLRLLVTSWALQSTMDVGGSVTGGTRTR